ncbi:hypothetical protein QJQ45_002614 [Haematococcus lacustris]|nr:hypothetical protein QJQ45_002614 [Haematococcus lacustris]
MVSLCLVGTLVFDSSLSYDLVRPLDHAWVEDPANRGRLLRHAVHTTKEMEAAMAAWQLDMVPWQQAELTNPGLLPRPPRPPAPYALTPTSKCQARHVFIDTRGLYGMMHDAGMLGVLTEEGVTSLKKFRNAYTNGSCIKTSEPAPARVGAGVYIPENNALITIALNDPENNTINKAELTAIHAALKAGARRIATDSLCSLYQIRRALANPMSLINHRHNDILTDIATLIVDSPDTIQFFKVKAHSGVIGNEGADALAKHAALHPEQANTLGYHPTTRRERGIWLSNGTDGETLAPLPDCRHSVRAHMHSRHKLGLANQDSIYYQMTQDITKAAAKGAGERVMTDTNISIPAQRTALLYRTGGLYNQKLAMRWKKATDDRCPLCGEADSATHLLSGCSATLPLVQERHNGAGRLIAKAISKGTLGGCIRFADTGSWEKGAKDNLDLPNDTLHTTLRALGLKTATTKNTTRPDILMVTPLQKTGKRGKAIKRVTIIEIKYCADSRWAEQLDKALNQHTKLAHTIRKEGHTVEIRPILLARPGYYIEGPKDSHVANRWDALLPDPRRQKLASPKHNFAQTVHTDGVAISVMFLRPKPAAPPAELPRMGKGLGAVNPLAHLHAEWLGVDPGKSNMATVAHEERSAAGTVVSVRNWKLTAALSRVSSKPSSLASYRQFADTVLATYDAMWAEVSKQRWANAKFRLYCVA